MKVKFWEQVATEKISSPPNLSFPSLSYFLINTLPQPSVRARILMRISDRAPIGNEDVAEVR